MSKLQLLDPKQAGYVFFVRSGVASLANNIFMRFVMNKIIHNDIQ